MILQLGSFFSSALSQVGSLVSNVAQSLLPVGLEIGKSYLAKALGQKQQAAQVSSLQAKVIQASNNSPISVATMGGVRQPVGGSVHRSTYTQAAQTPAQSGVGNIPLTTVPVGTPIRPSTFVGPMAFRGGAPAVPFGGPAGGAIIPDIRNPPGYRPSDYLKAFGSPYGPPAPGYPPVPAVRKATTMPNGNYPLALPGQQQLGTIPGIQTPAYMGGSRFFSYNGSVVKFVPSPFEGQGFLRLEEARAMGVPHTRPYWRFNLVTQMYEKIKRRRMNPLNIRATERAARRVNATIDTVKGLLKIQRSMTSGSVRVKTTRRRRRRKTTRCRKK
jgi:hypothetical protein